MTTSASITLSARISRFVLRRVLRYLVRPLLALRYNVEVTGLDIIRRANDGRGILFLPSHSALIDPVILYSLLPDYLPRPLADARQVDQAIIRQIVAPLRPLVINQPQGVASTGQQNERQVDRRQAVAAIRRALNEASQALNRGEHLLLYPAGRLTRDGQEHLGANSGAHAVLTRAPDCRVVLVRIRGLWGSSFSAAACGDTATPLFPRVLARGVFTLAANLFLFAPRRSVQFHFAEFTANTLSLPELGARALNDALENFYQAEPQPLSRVPSFFWQR